MAYNFGMVGKKSVATFVAVAGMAVSALNLSVLSRDVPMTVGTSTFDIERVIDGKEWVESPMQTLQTFMGAAVFPNVGNRETGMFDFVDRLIISYGEASIAETPIVDVREIFSEKDQRDFREQLSIWGYSSQRPCPHSPNQLCEVYVAWNRERTKEFGIRMISLRFGDNEYAIVDDSVVNEG